MFTQCLHTYDVSSTMIASLITSVNERLLTTIMITVCAVYTSFGQCKNTFVCVSFARYNDMKNITRATPSV